ncbi:MAG: hypothetical protein ACW98K_18460 [Candidatus Kariarchaeaceae archaeon]
MNQTHRSFPIATFSLLILFYGIGILSLDTNVLSKVTMDSDIIKRDILEQYSLVPEFRIQWQLFSYHLIHFALIHFAYVGILLLYYVQGLEKITSAKFILASYFVISILWPIPAGILLFGLVHFIPASKDYLLMQSYFLGSSVGIWGLIGLSVPSNKHRQLFWFGIVVLFIPEFALKILDEGKDITSNIAHLMIFLLCWAAASKFMLKNENIPVSVHLRWHHRPDRIVIIGIVIHAFGLIWYFIETLG